jgi:hypothetical protein
VQLVLGHPPFAPGPVVASSTAPGEVLRRPDTTPGSSTWVKDEREFPQLVLATDFLMAGSSLLTEQAPSPKGARRLLG